MGSTKSPEEISINAFPSTFLSLMSTLNTKMGSTKSPEEISIDAFPFLRLYKDGTIERLAGTQVAPPGLDPQTAVVSKDVVFKPETGVSARLYRPVVKNLDKNDKLPLVVHFHGGGFFISSTADPLYHNGLNRLVAAARVAVVSVDYRLAPEIPLPAAYDDCWAALQWLASDSAANEPWLKEDVDLDHVFLLGESAGANIAHHMVFRISGSDPKPGLKIAGIGLIHPYFWGEDPVGLEAGDPVRRGMVDRWWKVVCPSDKGNDDPLINPFADGAPSLEGLKGCGNILVLVAGKDILKDRGWLYYEKVKESNWEGTIEIVETEGEDHIFHLLLPESDEAEVLVKRLASFVNQKVIG